ncbi:MAG TPA: hypothetical protein VGP83_17050 [Pyrinomonadaceae bacterium]|nr:hypothetical protein [Pyrinomonadaceae bacterium]
MRFPQAAFIGETGDDATGNLSSHEKQVETMAKRAVLCDMNDVEIAHVSYSEMDNYITRGIVERLTPVRSKTHRFRLLLESTPAPEGSQHISPCTLSANCSRDNAGESGIHHAFWARRKVRAWPNVGMLKVGDHCPLMLRRRRV